MDILSKVVHKIGVEAVAAFISRTPNGKYARQIGCWFEILTGGAVPLPQAIDVPHPPPPEALKGRGRVGKREENPGPRWSQAAIS